MVEHDGGPSSFLRSRRNASAPSSPPSSASASKIITVFRGALVRPRLRRRMGNGHRTRRDRRARHRRPPGPGADIIAGVGGIAPIVGPLLGAVILQLSHWRVSFWVVAALGLVMTLAVVRPSPSHCRPSGGTAAACIRSWLPAGRSSGTGAMSATWWWPARRWVPCSPTSPPRHSRCSR